MPIGVQFLIVARSFRTMVQISGRPVTKTPLTPGRHVSTFKWLRFWLPSAVTRGSKA